MPIFVLIIVASLFVYLGCKLLWKPSATVVITFAILGALLGLPEGPPGIISGLIGGMVIGRTLNDFISKL